MSKQVAAFALGQAPSLILVGHFDSIFQPIFFTFSYPVGDASNMPGLDLKIQFQEEVSKIHLSKTSVCPEYSFGVPTIFVHAI